MRLKYKFEYVTLENEIIAVPVGVKSNQAGGVIKLNKEAFEIITLMEDNVTVQEIINCLISKYDIEEETLKLYVNNVIRDLKSRDILSINDYE